MKKITMMQFIKEAIGMPKTGFGFHDGVKSTEFGNKYLIVESNCSKEYYKLNH